MRYSRLRFAVAFGLAALAAGVSAAADYELGFSVGVVVAGLAWAAMLLDEVRGARAASEAFGRTARGFTRGQAARAIAMSWLIPGLGQVYAGERAAGLVTASMFLAGWVVANVALASPLILLPAAIALWIAGQVRVRRLVGVRWDPLIPSLGELVSRE